MSDEKGKPESGPASERETAGKDPPELLERYGRKGGTARREPGAKAGFWQRVADRIAPAPAAGRQAGAQRTTLDLILPDGKRVVVVVRSRAGELAAGVVEVDVEPTPANDPRVLDALAEVSHAGAEIEIAPGETAQDSLPIIVDDVGLAEIALTEPDSQWPPPPVPPQEEPTRRRGPSAPIKPLFGSQQDASSPTVEGLPREQSADPWERATASLPAVTTVQPESGPDGSADTVALEAVPLDELLPPRTPFAAALTKLDSGELDLPPPDPRRVAENPSASQGRRGPSRGGAARALFVGDTDEVRPAADSLVGHTAHEPERDRPLAARTDARPTAELHKPRTTRPDRPAAARKPAGSSRPPSVQLLGDLPPPDAISPPPAPRTDSQRQLPVIGIDFGTTYSSVAVMRAGIEVITDETAELQMPSVVSFPEPGVVLVGAEARARMAGAAQWTIASPKRLLGRLYRDPQVAQLVGSLAFRTFAGTDKLIRFEAHGDIYSVTDICAMILGKLRERSCRFLNADVRKAVFTVPVGFGTLQRSALELAARQAGLEVVSILSEPGAAVLSHGFRGRRGLVAIYDFGGGTFDFSLLQVTDTAFQVLCAGGDTWLGGDDFDHAMASYMADLFWNDTGVDLRTRAVEWQALVFACERAKRELSAKKEVEVRCDDLLFTQQGKRGLRYSITRKKFIELTRELVDKSILIAEKVLSQADVKPKKIDAIVLTGGTSFIPLVRDAVSRVFGRAPVMGDPNLSVAKGAALRGAELSGEAVAETSLGGRTLREVSGRTIGAAAQGGPMEVLFERSAQLPAEVRRTFYTTADGQTEMVVALYEEPKSRVDESHTIGHLRYKGLRAAPKGQGRVDFTFVLDEDGILHVSALVEGKQYERSIKLE